MKTISLQEAVGMIPDGACLMIGGFMACGTPEPLMDELVRQAKRNLTVIANDTGTGFIASLYEADSAAAVEQEFERVGFPFDSINELDYTLSAAELSGRRRWTSGISSRTWRIATATWFSPLNGTSPVSISKSTTPSEYRSDWPSTGRPSACSGET